jgi:hypothetical protein
MKNLPSMFVCLALLGGEAGIAVADTNAVRFVASYETLSDTNAVEFAKSYEKLTDDVLRNFKDDANVLRLMQTLDRELKTKLWLRLLGQISRVRNTHFDFKAPENMYYANVAPPLDPSNPRTFSYEAGTDPRYIKEPDIRKAFEETIQKNHQKALRFGFELRLKRLDEECNESAMRYFNSVYAKTQQDAKELVQCLEVLTDANHRAQMKDQLREYIELAKD